MLAMKESIGPSISHIPPIIIGNSIEDPQSIQNRLSHSRIPQRVNTARRVSQQIPINHSRSPSFATQSSTKPGASTDANDRYWTHRSPETSPAHASNSSPSNTLQVPLDYQHIYHLPSELAVEENTSETITATPSEVNRRLAAERLKRKIAKKRRERERDRQRERERRQRLQRRRNSKS